MIVPNFLIIGASRSGSTTLTHCLALHPQIYLVQSSQEPKFFSRQEEYAKGADYYIEKYFSRVDGYRAAGEKSTEYIENLSAAERIFRFNPHMKIICILRNPVERALSNYWWSVHNGVEKRPVNEAIKAEWDNYLKYASEITQLSATRPNAYIDRSIYYDSLLPYYRLFPKDRIKCIILEEFVKMKDKVVRDLCEFLSVSPRDLPVKKIEVQRKVERREKLDSTLYRNLKLFLYDKNKKMGDLTGVNIQDFWD